MKIGKASNQEWSFRILGSVDQGWLNRLIQSLTG